MHMHVRVSVCALVYACTRVCVHTRVSVCACVYVCVCFTAPQMLQWCA